MNSEPVKVLAGLTHMNAAQENVVSHLWRMTGPCAGCHRELTERSPKMALAVVNSKFCAISKFANTIGISLYCGRCTQAINELLKMLKPITASKGNGNSI